MRPPSLFAVPSQARFSCEGTNTPKYCLLLLKRTACAFSARALTILHTTFGG